MLDFLISTFITETQLDETLHYVKFATCRIKLNRDSRAFIMNILELMNDPRAG